MKKKYTNQASKYHSSIFSEDGPKSKAAPNYTNPDTELKSRELKPSPASTEMRQSTLDEANSLRRSYKAGQESGDPFIQAATQPYKEIAELKEEKFQKTLKSAVDRGEIERYKKRESDLGGAKKVSKKIARKKAMQKANEKIKKNLDTIGAGAAIVGGGLYRTITAGPE